MRIGVLLDLVEIKVSPGIDEVYHSQRAAPGSPFFAFFALFGGYSVFFFLSFVSLP